MNQEQIKENILKIKESIQDAEKKAGREAGSVRLCAVSKFHPAEAVEAALSSGQILFGENRVQEACRKFQTIRGRISSGESNLPEPELHIIGALQSNKVKKAVEASSCIQSVDRIPLLYEIEKHASSFDKNISVFLELHTAEDSKSGFADSDELKRAAELCSTEIFPHIILKGLMTMAPFTEDEKSVRKSFAALRESFAVLKTLFPELPLSDLSMGMSGDYKIAIEEGSTMVRIGTAIFGEREYK
ncbi:MAG: YggS family pyridoxal phosphate-dependent enzyme [Treponema sp.]|nr:YggS family pyridoxal phosphate-dependent enzyme [Treponema sp.]